MGEHRAIDSELHQALIEGFLQKGACPTIADLGSRLKAPEDAIRASLFRLAENHGVVLDSHDGTPWVVHPFSSYPTGTWVAKGSAGWWAPCIWCAFGIATLAGGEVSIHSRLGGESTPIEIVAVDGVPAGRDVDLLVHFAIPPRAAWDNVHRFCATVLPFTSESAIDRWAREHGLPRGVAVPLHKVAELGRRWYGTHADPGWRKWSPAEATDILAASGLSGGFWEIDLSSDRF